MGFKTQKGKNNCFLLGIYLEAVLFIRTDINLNSFK